MGPDDYLYPSYGGNGICQSCTNFNCRYTNGTLVPLGACLIYHLVGEANDTELPRVSDEPDAPVPAQHRSATQNASAPQGAEGIQEDQS